MTARLAIAMTRPPCRAYALLWLMAFASGSALAAEAEFTTTVAPNHWRALEIRNLPEGAVVDVEVRTSGPIAARFVDAEELARGPDSAAPLFRGQVDSRLAFTVVTRRGGDHYVVLDNREGEADRAVEIRVRARRGQSDPDAPREAPSPTGAGTGRDI